MNTKHKIIIAFAVICMVGCTPKSGSNYHFVPIIKDGKVYAYISAMTFGLAGGHDRIIVQRDTTLMDSNYFFYRDHLLYRVKEENIDLLKTSKNYASLNDGPLYNKNPKRIKNEKEFALPHRSR